MEVASLITGPQCNIMSAEQPQLTHYITTRRYIHEKLSLSWMHHAPSMDDGE